MPAWLASILASSWFSTLLDSPSPDLLRLLAVPVFGWAAHRDVHTRRVPNRTWLPLAALGIALLAWESWQLTTGGDIFGVYTARQRELYFLRVALSLGLVGSLGYLFYWFGGFGGADAKAIIVLAVLFPTFPTLFTPGTTYPLTESGLGVFSLTILSNAVLVGAFYPLGLALANLARGHVGKVMVIGRPIRATEATGEYGSLLETPEGFTRRGLDLDALRMYLRWRGLSLADIRDDPDRYRDPTSLPAAPNPPGDGSIPSGEHDSAALAGAAEDQSAGEPSGSDSPDAAATESDWRASLPGDVPDDDPWGAAAFLAHIEGHAYGTTPEDLRDGLDVLASTETVWISPGLPFIVPMFAGLLVSLVYGDVLVQIISAVV